METLINNYIDFCITQKRLDSKTIKAYNIDLFQFKEIIGDIPVENINTDILEKYIAILNSKYKAKTVKRKIASVKALFHFFEYKEIISANPFNKIHVQFREPFMLPKTIPLNTIETFLSSVYFQLNSAKNTNQRKKALQNVAIIEFLFSTVIRISELCNLSVDDVNLYDGTILIHGKGSKERRIQICNAQVLDTLRNYRQAFDKEIKQFNYFFANQSGKPVSDQYIRRMLNKYTKMANINLHITPHMFRHTFATSLLEEDVDIRYIQQMLGHSSINITAIYTHVTLSKQKDILASKHPRRNMKL